MPVSGPMSHRLFASTSGLGLGLSPHNHLVPSPGTPGVPEIAPIVAFEHHIRYDGGGYPRVPRSWKVNLASRIEGLNKQFGTWLLVSDDTRAFFGDQLVTQHAVMNRSETCPVTGVHHLLGRVWIEVSGRLNRQDQDRNSAPGELLRPLPVTHRTYRIVRTLR